MRALAALLICLLPTVASAQVVDDFNRTNLADLIPGFLSGGFIMAENPGAPAGSSEFIDDESPQLGLLRQLNNAIAVQLSSFPLSSSAGGFVYQFDPALGVFSRVSDSFGPVYGERGTTVGKGRFNVGMNFSSFTFDSIDGLGLRDGDLKMVFPHLDSNDDSSRLTPWFEGDVITSDLFFNMRTAITAFVTTYGVTDRFDLGLAVPIVEVEIDATAVAQLERLSTDADPSIHAFANGDDSVIATASGQATGLGDVVVRGKFNLGSRERASAAVVADVRAPTGDEKDLLGSGQWQAQAQLVVSAGSGTLFPHAALGYNLAGGDVPDRVVLRAGTEWVPHPQVTFSATYLGQLLRDVTVIESRHESFDYNTAPAGPPVVATEVLPQFGATTGDNVFTSTLALGLKINVWENLLLSASGLVSLGEDGLVDTFTPLVGIDVNF